MTWQCTTVGHSCQVNIQVCQQFKMQLSMMCISIYLGVFFCFVFFLPCIAPERIQVKAFPVIFFHILL